MARRGKELFLLSVGAAFVFLFCATIAGWIKAGFPDVGNAFPWLLLLTFVSSLAGPLLFAIVWPLFHSKERGATAAVLLGWSAVLGCLLGLFRTNNLTLAIMIPMAWLVVVTLTSTLLPSLHFPTGVCYKCGYDLTGNVSGSCSECGLAISEGEFLRKQAMTLLKDNQ